MGLADKLSARLRWRAQRQRSPEEQQQVDSATRGLALYQFPYCPYCVKVGRTVRRLQLHIELRDATNNPAHQQALRLEGGKLQTPCLRIEQAGSETQWLYESADIIRYLEQRFG
ncbi:MAG: glutaredoxin [Pseudomonadota bacterium]